MTFFEMTGWFRGVALPTPCASESPISSDRRILCIQIGVMTIKPNSYVSVLRDCLIGTLFSASSVVAYSQPVSADATNSDTELNLLQVKMHALERDIDSITSDLLCSRHSDCALIGYGARSCGGPDRFLIYSKVTTDVSMLEPLVRDFNATKRAYARKRGLRSPCAVADVPLASCAMNRCIEEPATAEKCSIREVQEGDACDEFRGQQAAEEAAARREASESARQ